MGCPRAKTDHEKSPPLGRNGQPEYPTTLSRWLGAAGVECGLGQGMAAGGWRLTTLLPPGSLSKKDLSSPGPWLPQLCN